MSVKSRVTVPLGSLAMSCGQAYDGDVRATRAFWTVAGLTDALSAARTTDASAVPSLPPSASNRKGEAMKARLITVCISLTALAAMLAPAAQAAGRWG